MIIGLTGSYCAGKDTVAEYLVKERRYAHYSLSDVIREEMKKAGIDTTRENLISFGTKLRTENGNGVLAKKVLAKIDDSKNYCITSIRHPDEVKELQKNKRFVLINVDAPQKIRFERMLQRNRAGDPKTFEDFVRLEKMESQSSGSGQQLVKTARLADIVFINDSNDMETMKTSVNEMLKQAEQDHV